MIKLNDNGLFIGEIKQLLANFNLPACAIGKDNAVINKHYIQDNAVWLLTQDNNLNEINTFISSYIFGEYYLNLTSQLRIDSINYDRYTHRYLGKYLRFIRDFKGIDLMSMYNCFDGDLATTELKFTDINNKTQIFDIDDPNYIIYQIPVTRSIYTLGLQVSGSIDMCITITNPPTNISEDSLKLLAKLTYRKYTVTKKVYLTDLFTRYVDHRTYGSDWAQCLEVLKAQDAKVVLYLRVPKTIKSSIACLEGLYDDDYINLTYTPTVGVKNVKEEETSTGEKILVGDEVLGTKTHLIWYPANPQLLSYQNNANYLLADGLLEYLTGNAITPMSYDYDIKKLHKYLVDKYKLTVANGIWGDTTTDGVNKIITDNQIYKYQYDVLPYCAKNVEKYISGGLL